MVSDLVRAEEGPAPLPPLCRGLSLGQPLLSDILLCHVWIEVQLVQSLEAEGRKTPFCSDQLKICFPF